MRAMGVMKMTANEIINMITVGDRFVSAAGAVNVFVIVTRARMRRCAFVRILCRHFEHMFVNVICVRAV